MHISITCFLAYNEPSDYIGKRLLAYILVNIFLTLTLNFDIKLITILFSRTNQEEIQRALRRNNTLSDNSSLPFSFGNLFDDIDLSLENKTSESNINVTMPPNLLEESGFNLTFLDDTDLIDYIEATNGGMLTQRVAIYVYSALILGCIAFMIMRSILFFRVCMSASRIMHDTMFSKVLGTPMRFFHLNNAGRILNRFSKDMGAVDELLPRNMLEALQV